MEELFEVTSCYFPIDFTPVSTIFILMMYGDIVLDNWAKQTIYILLVWRGARFCAVLVPIYGGQKMMLSVFLYPYLLAPDPPVNRVCHWTWNWPFCLDWPLVPTAQLTFLQYWGYRTIHHWYWSSVALNDTCSTELFLQADRHFKVLVDLYFSKLGNGETSNTKGAVEFSRYLRGGLLKFPNKAFIAEQDC